MGAHEHNLGRLTFKRRSMVSMIPVSNLPFFSCFDRIRKTTERPKAKAFIVDRGECSPFTFSQHDADSSGFIRFRQSHVSHVRLLVNASQICPAVIRSVAIYVIDVIRIVTSHPFPNHSMLKKAGAINRAKTISITFRRIEGRRSGPTSVPDSRHHLSASFPSCKVADRAHAPSQFTRLRAVIKKIAQAILRRQWGFSHSVLPHVRGQGRALLTQRFRPTFLSRIKCFLQVKQLF